MTLHGPGGAALTNARPERTVAGALWKGFRRKCPSCGVGALYRAFLKVADACPHCGEALHHHRADDAPPYVTIVVVGHVVVAGVLGLEQALQPPQWLHMALWLPLTAVLSLALLPAVKGSIVGLQWANYMHGFGVAAEGCGDERLSPEPPHQPR